MHQVSKAFTVYLALGSPDTRFPQQSEPPLTSVSLRSSGPGHPEAAAPGGPTAGGGVSSSWTLFAFLRTI